MEEPENKGRFPILLPDPWMLTWKKIKISVDSSYIFNMHISLERKHAGQLPVMQHTHITTEDLFVLKAGSGSAENRKVLKQ